MILDEINIVLADDTLPFDEALAFLADRPLTKHICVTGRGAPSFLEGPVRSRAFLFVALVLVAVPLLAEAPHPRLRLPKPHRRARAAPASGERTLLDGIENDIQNNGTTFH